MLQWVKDTSILPSNQLDGRIVENIYEQKLTIRWKLINSKSSNDPVTL